MTKEHESKDTIIKRLSRIEGHIRGIQKMVREDKECSEILHQVAAVQSALAATGRVLFEDHFQHCIIEKVKNGELREELMRFKESIATFSRGIR